MNTSTLVTENLATIARVCGRFNTHLSQDDLVHEVVLHLLAGAAKHFDPTKGSAKNFAAKVAKNKCLAIMDKHENSRRGDSVDTVGVDADADEKASDVVLVDYDTPFAAAVRAESSKDIFAIAASLSDAEWRLFVELHRAKRFGDVATALGVSNATVTRAWKALAAKLAGE